MTRLHGAEFVTWLMLRRVHRGGLAKLGDRCLNHGRPLPSYLPPDLLAELTTAGLLTETDPDESGMRRISLTDAGQARYAALCQQQRDLSVPQSREFGPTETPADHQPSIPPSATATGQLDPTTRPTQPVPLPPDCDHDCAATCGYLDALRSHALHLVGLLFDAVAPGELGIPATARWVVSPIDSRRHVLADDTLEFHGSILARCGRYLPSSVTTEPEASAPPHVPLCADCAAIVVGPPRFSRP